MYIRIAFSIELRLRVSRSLRSLANKSVPTVRRLKICTVKCIGNSLIHNLQDKRPVFLCLVISNMTIAMILL